MTLEGITGRALRDAPRPAPRAFTGLRVFGRFSALPSRPSWRNAMQVLDRIAEQIDALSLPLFAVTLTALPRANTPVLLMLHWHGFRADPEPNRGAPDKVDQVPVPASALQLQPDWRRLEHLDEGMLEAAWRLGAWELEREERRGCNTPGAPDREILECRQAFGEPAFRGLRSAHDPVADAPDRAEMLEAGARLGYIRWKFRPVRGGVWQATAHDDSLALDGGRDSPCPVLPQAPVGTAISAVTRRLGRVDRLILL